MSSVNSPSIGSTTTGIILYIGITLVVETQFVFHLPVPCTSGEYLLLDNSLPRIRYEEHAIELQSLLSSKCLSIQIERSLLSEQVNMITGV